MVINMVMLLYTYMSFIHNCDSQKSKEANFICVYCSSQKIKIWMWYVISVLKRSKNQSIISSWLIISRNPLILQGFFIIKISQNLGGSSLISIPPKKKTPKRLWNKGCVTRCVALPFTLKSILKQKKKNYGNSNISPCKNIIFRKTLKRNQNPSRYYNSITDLKFQHKKPKYHLSKILIK